jgi:hypothetical protein
MSLQDHLVAFTKQMHSNGLYKRPGGRLRLNGTEICCQYFKHLSMSTDAIVAGMEEQKQLIEVKIAGNPTTDAAMATTLRAITSAQVSMDDGVTWLDCSVDGTIKNTGIQWIMRLAL